MLQLATNGTSQTSGPASPLELVDADGIAELLRVSRRTLDRIIRKEKHFPKLFRIGARNYVRLSDLQSWAEMKAKAA